MRLTDLCKLTRNCSNEKTAEIYTNYDSQYPAQVLVTNQGYRTEELYAKNGFSFVAFIIGVLCINTLLELTK